MAKVVKAPLVVATREDGSQVYLYAETPFPTSGLAEGEEKRLAEFLEDGSEQADDEGDDKPKRPARKSSNN